MEQYQQEFEREQEYLKKTTQVISCNLQQERQADADGKETLIEAKRELWENSNAGKLQDANQYIESIQMKASTQYATSKRIEQYEKALSSPYFARIDFKESGYPEEKIYIGLHAVTNEEDYETYVYDWRAPISSMFYRYEPGPASYPAPVGTISGELTRKRQYEITNGKLHYFFDSNVNIQDEILRHVLSQNASPKMKSIVETIQRQQDEIIRDSENELLIVQGVAGSGKTSVALHRVAYLMYQGLTQHLSAQNIVIISPNSLFGKYIANVLPELGEENITSLTFDDLFTRNVPWQGKIETKLQLTEALSACTCENENDLQRSSLTFFTSAEFCTILQRYLRYFRREKIPFSDIYYNKKVIATRQEMKAFLFSNNRHIPTQKALQLIEKRLWDEIHRERKKRLPQLAHFFSTFNEHRYDYRSYARYTSILEATHLKRQIRSFTEVDIAAAYVELLCNKDLLFRLADGIVLPPKIHEILDDAASELKTGTLGYGTSMGLLYFTLLFTGASQPDIKQVVVDEAQDYFPIHFYILKAMFGAARFTIMGDINQTIEKDASLETYEEIKQILNKKTATTLFLNKGFRCSYEIGHFSEQFLETAFPVEHFDRHDEAPQILSASTTAELDQLLVEAIEKCQGEGFRSIAVVCKTSQQADELAKRLEGKLPITCLHNYDRTVSGIVALPVSLAKGLEFDAAMIYETNAQQYHTSFDKKLLYICSTRPLHRLFFFHTGELSPLFH